MQKNILIKILAITVSLMMVVAVIPVFAVDLVSLIASDNFDDVRGFSVRTEGNVRTEIVEESPGNNALCYTTANPNSLGWATQAAFEVTAGSSTPIGKVKMRMRLDSSVTANSVQFGLLNKPFSVTKEWQNIEISLTSNYSAFAIQCPSPDIIAYIDDVEIYSVVSVDEPRVSASFPEHNGEAAPSDFMTVTYNNTMDESAENYLNYVLSGGTQTVTAVEKTGDKTYKISFSDILSEFTPYTLTISGLTDSYNLVMSETVISFTTTEYSRPIVVETVPNNGAYGVSNGDTIRITYDQRVNIDDAVVSLSDVGDCEIESDGGTISIVLSNLKSNKPYSLTLSGVKNSLDRVANDYVFEFITLPEIDYLYKNTFELATDIEAPMISLEKTTVLHDKDGGVASTGAVKLTPQQYGQLFFRSNGAAIKLEAGKTYTCSFDIKADAALGVWLMNGRYDNTFYLDKTVGTEYTTISYTFTVTEAVDAPYIQFASAVGCYIDNIQLYENKPAELVESSDLYSDEVVRLDTNFLKFVFNKGLNEASVISSNIKLNGIGVMVAETGANYFIVSLGYGLEFGADYTLDINIKDENGMAVKLTRGFMWKPAVDASLSLNKSGGKFILTANDIKNNSAAPQSVAAILILYQNGEMVDAIFVEDTLDPYEQLLEPISVELPAGAYEAKGFLWDSMSTRNAYAPAVTKN